MIEYEINGEVFPSAIAALRESVGWYGMEEYYRSPAMISFCHVAAYDNGSLVGYADCTSNGLTDAYIQDVMVSPFRRRRPGTSWEPQRKTGGIRAGCGARSYPPRFTGYTQIEGSPKAFPL